MTPDPDAPIYAVCVADEWFVLDEDIWADLALLSDEGDEDDE